MIWLKGRTSHRLRSATVFQTASVAICLLLSSNCHSLSVGYDTKVPQTAFLLGTSSEPPSDTRSLTFIDLLSNSTSHSKLLHLIQRARLVPTINLLNSTTFFAPTNAAIETYLTDHPRLQSAVHPIDDKLELDDEILDNLQIEVRQTILYHILNSTFPSSISSQAPELFETLLLPKPIQHTSDNSNAPDRNLPESNHSDLLGGHGQKLRLFQRSGVTFVGVDGSGHNGTSVPPPSEFHNVTNGILISIEAVLTPPPNLIHVIQSNPSLSTYLSILPAELIRQLETTPHLTLFAPHESAWLKLDPIEMAYLRSNYSANDSINLFKAATSANVLGSQNVGYSSLLRQEIQSHPGEPAVLKVLSGQRLEVSINSTSAHLIVNGSEIIEQDILASNGVLHVVPRLLLPSESNPLGLNAEKYLLALNCSRFVSLFRAANLSSTYLTNTSSALAYTILAPRDDALGILERNDRKGAEDPENSIAARRWNSLGKDDNSLKKALTYHIIQGNHFPEDLSDGMLLSTELSLKGDSELKQRMPVSVSVSDGKGAPSSNENLSIIGFGGANVVGGNPVRVGNIIIYIISQIIEAPSDLLQVALSDIRLSTCVASIFAAKLEEQLTNLSGLTFLVPTNKAFVELGLIMDYLLLEKSKDDLKRVLKYHAITEVVYLKDIKIGNSKRYPTLEGTEIYISKLGAKNVTLHGPTAGGIPLNGENKDSEVINRKDMLIENGSMDIMNQVELPSDIMIDLRKLMLGAKASTMLELIESSHMGWILDSGQASYHSGKEKDSPQINLARSFTILCPSDEAFTKINLTYYLEDRTRLQSLVLQHIIPTHPSTPTASNELDQPEPEPFKPLYIGDGTVYRTLLSSEEGGPSEYGDVSFRVKPTEEEKDDSEDAFKGKWLIGIKGARGTDGHHDSARVRNYGRATPKVIVNEEDGGKERMMFGGGVLSLDRVLEPYEPNAWERWGQKFVTWLAILSFLGGLGFMGWKLYIVKRPGSRVGYSYVEPMEE